MVILILNETVKVCGLFLSFLQTTNCYVSGIEFFTPNRGIGLPQRIHCLTPFTLNLSQVTQPYLVFVNDLLILCPLILVRSKDLSFSVGVLNWLVNIVVG